MIQIDSRIYDDIFLLAKILEKTELSKDEKARVYKRFEKSTEIQEILNYLDTTLHPIISPDNWNVYSELHDMVSKLPSAQPNTCDGCMWEDAFGYGECYRCKRAFSDMYEVKDEK